MLSCALVRLVSSVFLASILALAAGCGSDPRPEEPAGTTAAAPDFPPAMAGSESFDEGRIVVQVTLGLPTHFRPVEDGKPHRDGDTSGSHHGGGHRSGGGMGGGFAGGAYPGGMQGGGEGPPSDSPSNGNLARTNLTGSNLPPAQLKLHLQNTSATDAVSCEVVDFSSSLGNFAVYPSRYQIEVGQTLDSETMTSRLGVEGSDIPVHVALKIHSKVEQKVVTLHLLPKPDHPAATSGH